MYKYFISYFYYYDDDFKGGSGNCEIKAIRKIQYMEDIRKIENALKKENNRIKLVIILNYKLLREEK